MKSQCLLTVACLAVWLCPQVARSQTDSPEWWLKPHRMLQTNLREIDATMDLGQYVEDVKQFGADVVLFNVGGIVANYPTELECHYRNPHMTGDLVGTVLERLHAEGIRVIGRFDFSKINEKFAAEHPEWLYVSEKGEHVNYNGQVHTCVSGGYQQQSMFQILGEALDRYPLDGVFFNMIGYQRRDYSGNHHGICQCDNCRRLFKDYSGLDLPPTQSESPAYRKYVEFTNMMKDKQFNRVNAFLKAKRPDLAICTYTPTGVDVIRQESNSRLGRGAYHDTDKAKSTLLVSGRRQLANAAVHFIDIPYRHAAVAPYLTARRLWQQMVNGAWLDFYCIGPLGRQEDRTGLELAAEIYRFHAAHERWLGNTRPAGEVGLVRRGDQEYEGILQILCESHVAFELARLEPRQLGRFSLVIVPDAGRLDPQEAAALDDYVQQGGRLLLTRQVPQGLSCLGSARLVETRPPQKGAYLRIRPEDKARLKIPLLDDLDLVFLEGEFCVYEAGEDVEKLLRLIPGDMFGPPEKCYYRNVSDHPAFLCCKHEKGAAACFPFGIGTHYAEQAHQGHAALLLGAVDNLLGLKRRVRVSGSPLVEVNHRADPNGRFEWISLYNHSGQRGNALHEPIPIGGIGIRFMPKEPVRSVRLLRADREWTFTKQDDGRIALALPPLKHYEIVVFEYEQ
jgi:hypothetical protein